eukprot:c19207_g1_i1.p1 GENE.c19207_g1_i1~~c19207_g1_i1.p1  ORF type:complete len:295 (-),score=99.69 c19207_g1_i1:27-911(-)
MSSAHAILKEKGNELFQKGKFDAAIDAYTEAICLSPSTAIYYTNRALCYFKKGDYEKTIQDCEVAVRLDSHLVKGYYFKGLALEKLNNLTDALIFMERGLDICNIEIQSNNQDHVNFVNEIRQMIKQTKKKKSDLKREEDVLVHSQMSGDLSQLLFSDLEFQKQKILNDTNISVTEQNIKIQELDEKFQTDQLDWINFLQQRNPTNPSFTNIPEFLCCSITKEICADPCVSPYGDIYDRGVIEQHLRSGNNFDPVTGKPLSINQLYPNLGIRQAIDCFYENNVWADPLGLTNTN